MQRQATYMISCAVFSVKDLKLIGMSFPSKLLNWADCEIQSPTLAMWDSSFQFALTGTLCNGVKTTQLREEWMSISIFLFLFSKATFFLVIGFLIMFCKIALISIICTNSNIKSLHAFLHISAECSLWSQCNKTVTMKIFLLRLLPILVLTFYCSRF